MKKVPWRILFVRELLSFYISKKPSLKNILLSLLMTPESIFVLYIHEYINVTENRGITDSGIKYQQYILAHYHCTTDGKMKGPIDCVCFSLKNIPNT